jgi:hypothetical protein
MKRRESTRSKKRNPDVILNDFYSAAWPVILEHYNNVIELNPEVQEDTRDQGSRATLIPTQGEPIQGTSGDANIHAESKAYDAAWNLAKETTQGMSQVDTSNYFDDLTTGATISCDGHKASCFMCAAICPHVRCTD